MKLVVVTPLLFYCLTIFHSLEVLYLLYIYIIHYMVNIPYNGAFYRIKFTEFLQLRI